MNKREWLCNYFIDQCGDVFGILLTLVYNDDNLNNIIFDSTVNDLNLFLNSLDEEISILSSQSCQQNNHNFLDKINNYFSDSNDFLRDNLLRIIRYFKKQMMARNEKQLEPCIELIFELNNENEDVYKIND
uniref:Uncharacterized protein n=1 Tax=Meloidogyne hapla TaxID=6305 RepID=A0A1I8B246_MELHA